MALSTSPGMCESSVSWAATTLEALYPQPAMHGGSLPSPRSRTAPAGSALPPGPSAPPSPARQFVPDAGGWSSVPAAEAAWPPSSSPRTTPEGARMSVAASCSVWDRPIASSVRSRSRPRVSGTRNVEAVPHREGIVTWGVTLGSLIGIFSVPLTGATSDRTSSDATRSASMSTSVSVKAATAALSLIFPAELVGPSIPHYRRPQNTAISQVGRLDPNHHRTYPLSPTGIVASLRSHDRQSTAPRSGDPDAASHPPRPSGAQTLQRL